jgi:hypothetical protein
LSDLYGTDVHEPGTQGKRCEGPSDGSLEFR